MAESPALRLRRNAWADLHGIFCTVVGGIVILQHRRAHERLQVGTGALAHAPSESLEAMAFAHTILHYTALNHSKMGGVDSCAYAECIQRGRSGVS